MLPGEWCNTLFWLKATLRLCSPIILLLDRKGDSIRWLGQSSLKNISRNGWMKFHVLLRLCMQGITRGYARWFSNTLSYAPSSYSRCQHFPYAGACNHHPLKHLDPKCQLLDKRGFPSKLWINDAANGPARRRILT